MAMQINPAGRKVSPAPVIDPVAGQLPIGHRKDFAILAVDGLRGQQLLPHRNTVGNFQTHYIHPFSAA